MQLKLFIETLVLQKREKPRYKAVAREACEKNTQERNRKRGKPRSRGLKKRMLEDKRAGVKVPAAPGSSRLGAGVGGSPLSRLPSATPTTGGPVSPRLSYPRDIKQTLISVSSLPHPILGNSKAEV